MDILYFAYGSNMCSNRLHNRVSCDFFDVATLKGYVLKFHKRSTDGSGKCNVLSTNSINDKVFGVIFKIPEAEKPRLDQAEGLTHGYNEIVIPVFVKEESINVHLYVADANFIDNNLSPYTWYEDFVIGGAQQHKLPNEYIKMLNEVGAIKDLDATREQRERSILPC